MSEKPEISNGRLQRKSPELRPNPKSRTPLVVIPTARWSPSSVGPEHRRQGTPTSPERSWNAWFAVYVIQTKLYTHFGGFFAAIIGINLRLFNENNLRSAVITPYNLRK
ncbi:MAG: hypothetical protein EHM89_00770 [Acidobacteria bacterium]|nr:MAG: hypothetical protein EHM89_00770 [Acidobacteriota bacterium]